MPAPRATNGTARAKRDPRGATSLHEALDWAARRIGEVSATPRLDAELLLAHLLGRSREGLLADSLGARRADAAGDPAAGSGFLDEHHSLTLRELVERRVARREPVAYIVGERHFRHLVLGSDRRALIPRPETELLVEVGLALPQRIGVLDLGTGSGAVALALKDERPDLSITGSDRSTAALELAGENGRRLGLDVRWLHADLLAGLPEDFAALLCNPPYVAERERALLAPEILEHEPAEALFAGDDGMAVHEALVSQLSGRSHVRLAALEVGAGQASAVGILLARAGFDDVRCLRDLAGIERVVVGERDGGPRARA